MAEREQNISKLWELWKNCSSYMESKDMFNMVDRCTKFFEGNHWGKVSGNTKDLPRVTINQTEMITNSKVSGILQNNVKVTFFSDENPAKAEEFTRFNAYIEKEMKFNETCANIVEDGAVVGGAPVYFYWDEDAVGKHGEYKGGLRCEQLDILSLGVHNPRELDIQKQKWIILKTRQEVDEVKRLCERDEDRDLIVADDEDKRVDADDEQDGSNLCTVLTKFFRINGEVYFEKATKNVVIHGARPLNPNLIELDDEKLEEIDNSRDNLSDKPTKEKDKKRFMATLYPIELYAYKKKKGCIYGRGEVEPIIMNNKAINFSFAMIAKSIEDLGFGQVVARDGALAPGQRLSNDPTQILIDKYKGQSTGFYSLNKQPFPAQVPNAISAIIDSTRSVTGATEVMTGETMGSNQSGTSIAYLQQQAQRPLNKLTERYKRFRERCAEIMAQFYILYYKDKSYTYKKDEVDNFSLPSQMADGGQEPSEPNGIMPNQVDGIMPNQVDGIMPSNVISATFNGAEFEDLDFDISCEAGTGSEWSELSELNMLELALTQNQIDFETFLNAYPSHLITNKDALLSGIRQTKEGIIAQQTQTIEALKQQLAQCQAYIKQNNQTVSNASGLVKRNRELESFISNLQGEYTNKINNLNAINGEVTNDASEFAQAIYNAQQNGQKG